MYPRTTRHAVAFASGVVALTLLASACSTKANSGPSGDTGGVKTDIGVTSSAIKLGLIPDLSGPFAENSGKIANAEELVFQQANAAGGVCGRKLDVSVTDSGYDVQKATVAYSTMKASVLGFPMIFGSAINASLLSQYAQDDMTVFPGSEAADLLSSRNVVSLSGYDYEIINLLDYWLDRGVIHPGDSIGHIALEGGLGDTGLSGSRHVAAVRKLKLVTVRTAPTDTDLTAQIADLKSAGVKAILVSSTPGQTAAVAVAAQATGLDVPIGANGASFGSAILEGASRAPLLQRLWLSQAWIGPSSQAPAVTDFIKAYEAAYKGQTIDSLQIAGLVVGRIWMQILKNACNAKDLTRRGVLNAKTELANFDTGGLTAPLNFSEDGKPGTTASFIFRPDPSVLGGMKAITDHPVAGADISGYVPTGIK